MKITKALIGKYVEVAWRDPRSTLRRIELRDAPKGRAAFATWKERGVVDDVTDGAVRIIHSYGEDPPLAIDPQPEIVATWVDEALIERITVYEPVKTEQEGAA